MAFTSRIVESANLIGLLINYNCSARSIFTISYIKRTLNLVKDDLFADFIATAKRKFTARLGHEPKVYPVVISDGAHKID